MELPLSPTGSTPLTPHGSPPKKACCTPSAPRTGGTVAARLQGFVDAQSQHAQSVGGYQPLTDLHPPIRHADAGSPDGMVHLPGGAFLMGTDYPQGFPEDGEGPVREVTLKPFWIDTTTVSNAQFERFVDATGYVTEAERFGWSFVFHLHLPRKFVERLKERAQVPGAPWWVAVPGAHWRRPFGEKSSLKGLEQHPVVHVSWSDAMAYAQWAGKRLPTEHEWEYAARGGTVQQLYTWGNELEPRGKHRCNVWQGKFPEANTAADGYLGTCPVDAFSPNAYGLYNMQGNVWEWTADWFSPQWHIPASERTRIDPLGPVPHDEQDREGKPGHEGQPSQKHGGFTHKVQKGGSYLCHASYCNRYRLGARTANTPDSGTTNNGFRCVRDA